MNTITTIDKSELDSLKRAKGMLQIFSVTVSVVLGLTVYHHLVNPIIKEVPVPGPTEYVHAQIVEPLDIDFETWKEIDCLALNIYHEARGELIAGMQAVAHVTRNRVKSKTFPDNYCEVIYQKKQFSWTFDGLSDEAKDRKSFAKSLEIAYDTIMFDTEDVTNGALYYHKNDGKTKFTPAHYNRLEKLGIVDSHKFFAVKAKYYGG